MTTVSITLKRANICLKRPEVIINLVTTAAPEFGKVPITEECIQISNRENPPGHFCIAFLETKNKHSTSKDALLLHYITDHGEQQNKSK